VGWTSDAAVRASLQIPVVDQRPFYDPHLFLLDRRGMIGIDAHGRAISLPPPSRISARSWKSS
jgi:hypothetical protein